MEGLKPPSRPREVCSDFLNGRCTSAACGFSHTGGVQRDMRAFFSAPTTSTDTQQRQPLCRQPLVLARLEEIAKNRSSITAQEHEALSKLVCHGYHEPTVRLNGRLHNIESIYNDLHPGIGFHVEPVFNLCCKEGQETVLHKHPAIRHDKCRRIACTACTHNSAHACMLSRMHACTRVCTATCTNARIQAATHAR